jgi:RNA 2',3'-cyclic 3'-phosphodiesterase
MPGMRLFVAVIPPPAIVTELSRRLAPLQAPAPPGLRWTSPDSWHITLAFLGEVPQAVLPELTGRLEQAARDHPVADLRLRGGGAFPRAARAWAVTAVVTGPAVAPPAELRPLDALAAAVAVAAREAGAPPPADDPPYRAHLTLARLRPAASVSPLLARLAGLAAGPWRAADIRLIRSHAGGAPSGAPAYAELGRWPLREPAG